jgi:hypothetical protein
VRPPNFGAAPRVAYQHARRHSFGKERQCRAGLGIGPIGNDGRRQRRGVGRRDGRLASAVGSEKGSMTGEVAAVRASEVERTESQRRPAGQFPRNVRETIERLKGWKTSPTADHDIAADE